LCISNTELQDPTAESIEAGNPSLYKFSYKVKSKTELQDLTVESIEARNPSLYKFSYKVKTSPPTLMKSRVGEIGLFIKRHEKCACSLRQ